MFQARRICPDAAPTASLRGDGRLLPGDSSLQAMQAVFALARGDTEEVRHLLGPQQERKDAKLKLLIREAALGEPSRRAQPSDEDLDAAVCQGQETSGIP